MRPRTVDIDRIGGTTLVLTGVASLCFGCIFGSLAAWSAAAGGALSTANLHLIRATVSRLIARSDKSIQGVGLVVLKLGVMVALVACAFYRLPVAPVPFAVGISMLLVAVLLDACVLGEPLSKR